MMNLAAALLYWVIVALWVVVLGTVATMYARNPRGFGTARLLLLVILIDTVRNIVENVYFGVYWSGQFGLFPTEIISPLNNSTYVLFVKMFNVVVGCLVLGVLLLRWFPATMRERELAAAKLAASDHQATIMASALDGASAPILVIDAQSPSRPVVYANAAYFTRYNKTKADVIGRPVDVAATFKEDPTAAAMMAQAILEARAHKAVVNLRHPDGHVTINEITLQPITDDAGQVVLLTALCTDVTAARDSSNDNAGQRDRMVGQMAGAVAHDFNNLLTVMLGSLATARNSLSPRSSEGQAVNLGMAAAERSSRLAKRLLNYSANRGTPSEVVDVNSVIENVQMLLGRAVADNVRVMVLPTPERCVCDIDVGAFEDALMNLVINASHAMPGGGTVTIATSVERADVSKVVVKVSDTGVGMTPEVQARAFERFYTTKGRGQGSGLGLSLVREFAQSAGGDVTLASTPGTGTVVTLTLPLVASAQGRDATDQDTQNGVAAE